MMEHTKDDAEPPIITIENVDDHESNHEPSDGNEAGTIVVEIDNTPSSAVMSLDVPEAANNGNEAKGNGQASLLKRNKSVYSSCDKIHFDEEVIDFVTIKLDELHELFKKNSFSNIFKKN